MFCDEVLDAIEPIAAGELTADGRIAAHLDTCANCAAALASARRVDLMLRSRLVVKPGPQFTSRTLAALRRERWRSEQYVDAGFNVALAVIVAAVVVGIWLLMRRSGLTVVGGDALDLFAVGANTLAGRIASSLTLYGAAAGVILAAIGLWWWTERGATV